MGKKGFLGILLCLCTLQSTAQISPGELSAAHAHLEGVGHCTACHSVGKALSDENCLACHGEIQTRIGQRKGFHHTIGSKHCFECHKEHHGRGFEIVRFDRNNFDHASVGFPLEGSHAKLECERCHTRNRITARDIQSLSDNRKRKTFLGLSSDCRSCHTNEHKDQLSVQCRTCHSFDRWKPAVNFSHDRSRFPLTGKHANVECRRCHKNTLADGTTIQYVKMSFASCQSCHADVHGGKFSQPCAQCHTTEDFHRIRGSVFDHSLTQFPLAGKHASLACERCHAKNPRARNASNEIGFHITKFRQCSNCHGDAHARQFEHRSDGGKCESCHSVEGFTPVNFSASEHSRVRFALTGAHAAVPCAKCHEAGKVKAKSSRQFHWNGSPACTTCHRDVHQGQFASAMNNGCETCHTTESWKTLKFAHDTTQFPLKGRHADVACSQCHKRSTDAPNAPVRYAGTPRQCSGCHADEHEKQFEIAGGTRCERCHTEQGWKRLSFDHNSQSQFVLSGRHAEVPCMQCHTKETGAQRTFVRYKPVGRQCTDCHRS